MKTKREAILGVIHNHRRTGPGGGGVRCSRLSPPPPASYAYVHRYKLTSY